jgi:hypothetical protein
MLLILAVHRSHLRANIVADKAPPSAGFAALSTARQAVLILAQQSTWPFAGHPRESISTSCFCLRASSE